MSHLSDGEAGEELSSEDFVAGVLDDRSAVDSAVRDLGRAGVAAGSIRIYTGQRGSEAMGDVGGEGVAGAVKRVMADYVGGAKDFTDRHKEEARLGHHVVLVPVSEALGADRVQAILALHGGHDIVARFGDQYEALSDVPKDPSA